ncbi:MAG: SBBP repeat-containing protein [Bacteroidetes bacterium]|nr:SBBP repeat-containing protein [Bacteroidota bacterium]
MGIEEGRSVVVDDSSNVYLTGLFTGSADFDPSNNMFLLTAAGGSAFEGYVVKLDINGDLVWAKQLGGTNSDVGRGISINSNGDLFVTGTYRGTADLDPSLSAANFTSNGSDDVFIVKLDRNGNFGWAKSIGGSGADLANGIAVDSFSNVIVIGQFLGNVDFDPSVGNSFIQAGGFYDTFILKLDSSGNFNWAQRLNSTSNVNSRFVKTDNSNNIYLTGGFTGTLDINPDTNITQNIFNAGSDDVFVLKLNENGRYLWGFTAGGLNFDQATSLEISHSSHIFISGFFNSTIDFDPSPGILSLTPTASRDAFIAKYSNPTITSLQSVNNNSIVRLSPNPTNGSVFLDLKTVQENIKYSIYDLRGKLISTEHLLSSTSSFSISFDGFPRGVYIVSISTHQFSTHQRIVIQ